MGVPQGRLGECLPLMVSYRSSTELRAYLHVKGGWTRDDVAPYAGCREERCITHNHTQVLAARDSYVRLPSATQEARILRADARNQHHVE